MHHQKFHEVRTLINANIPVLLTGEKGSGKTTLALQIAEDLKIPFYSISMTRQTTLSHLLGFMNVNGTYIPSLLRKAVSEGGMMLLDEMDAADANVLLALNTIENGYVSFPDGLVELHENFRLVATANPFDEHAHYTGRTKLDASTLDRFDIINIPRDEALEKSLIQVNTYIEIKYLREVIKKYNLSTQVSMRDAIRYQKRKDLNLATGYIDRILVNSHVAREEFYASIENLPKHTAQQDCNNIKDLINLMKASAA